MLPSEGPGSGGGAFDEALRSDLVLCPGSTALSYCSVSRVALLDVLESMFLFFWFLKNFVFRE